MYAETFNVRAWLEEPAKWLRWAMQSLTSLNSTDVRYNLQQFWGTLAKAKTQAQTQQDWSEILTLDAQSQWTLGSLYQQDAQDVLKEVNKYMVGLNMVRWTNPVAFLAAKIGIEDPGLKDLRAKMEKALAQAQIAFDSQVNLASQARAAAQAAGVESQAAATLKVGQDYKAGADTTAEWLRSQANKMGQPPDLPDPFKALKDAMGKPLLGIPLWGWLAGGAAVLLLITTAPAMAQAAAVRRMVED